MLALPGTPNRDIVWKIGGYVKLGNGAYYISHWFEFHLRKSVEGKAFRYTTKSLDG